MPISLSLSSGLDVQSIVSQLIQAESAPERALQQARAALSNQSKALDAFEQRLKSFNSAADTLRLPTALDLRSGTSSDESSVSASVAAGSQIGSYQVSITSLASTHSYASKGFASADTTLTSSGSFDLTVGDATTSIEVDAGATLASLRDAITAANAGVQAQIVFDGSSYRLSLTSKTSGAAGAITLGNWSSGALQSALSFAEKSPARDAAFSINGLEMTRGSNHVTDAVDGLTLDLKKQGGEAAVTVGADVAASTEAIRTFVNGYNALNDMIRQQLASAGKEAGPLAALSSVRRLQDKLKDLISRNVANVDSSAVNLRQIGIELQNDGSLVINDSKLKSAVTDGSAGKLFSLTGRGTDRHVHYVSGSSDTTSGSYAVKVTRAAERAVVTSATSIDAGGIAQDEKLTFTQGSKTIDVQLTAGQTLAQVASTINEKLGGTGIDALASDDGTGKLQLRSTRYGSAATLSVKSDTDAAGSTGVLIAGLSGAGIDAAGTIDGVAASGIGRVLTAASGKAKGLSLQINATPDEVDPGGTSFGNALVSLGVGEAVNRLLDTEIGSKTGVLGSERAGIRNRDSALADRLEAMDRRLTQRQTLLTQQLSRADQALQRMQSLSQSLAAQLGR